MVKPVADRPKASKASPEPDDLKTLSMSALEAKLESSSEGLSQDEASKRLKHYDPNEIKEAKTNPYLKFLNYLAK